MPKQRLLRILLCLVFVCLGGQGVAAQDPEEGFTPYDWYTANLWLSVPGEWEMPLETSQPGRLMLTLKPRLDDEQDPFFTAPETPIITLTRYLNAGNTQSDLRLRLSEAFQLEGLVLTDFVTVNLLMAEGLQVQGTSLDGQRVGLGQAVNLDGDILLVLGVGPVSQQAEIAAVIAGLFVESAALMGLTDTVIIPSEGETLEYGVLWHSGPLVHEDLPLIDLSALAAGPENSLYSFERYRGLARFDTLTGHLTAFFPNEDILDTFSLSVDSAGRVYVADPLCMCIALLASADSGWALMAEDVFHAGSPVYLAVGQNDILYATNHSPQGEVTVYALQGQQVLNSYPLPESVTDQPLLATHDGVLYLLTSDHSVYVLENDTLSVLFSLQSVTQDSMVDFAPLGDGLFAVVTLSEGVLVVTEMGEIVARPGRLVPGFPLPGEFVWPTGIVAGKDGTLYIVDSDQRSAMLTAFSPDVQPGRIGEEKLQLDQPVQGTLDRVASQQTWTYEGQAGQEITLTAVNLSATSEVDVALRLLAPDGATLAENDNHDGDVLFGLNDAQISSFTLPTHGHYIIVVEHRSGEGAYGLGITETRPFTLTPEGVTLEGQLSESVPVQRWALEASAGQWLTLTQTAQSDTLDPLLRVWGPGGDLIAENDNAEAATLGLNAQIVNLNLPESGRYIIETGRFDGNGAYTLTVIPVSAPE